MELKGKRLLLGVRQRGVSYWTDVTDWLGGYPYEDARIAEVVRFGQRKIGLLLLNMATGNANTEYLFRRAAVSNGTDATAPAM